MTEGPSEEDDAVALLRDPRTIRVRCQNIRDRGVAGNLEHFAVHPERIDQVARRVVEVTRNEYPDLAIPVHGRMGHFAAGGVNRLAAFEARLKDAGAEARARARIALVVTSVLLDAGAGPTWKFRERSTGLVVGRSEGLALASLHLFMQGAFSSDPADPLRVDAEALTALDMSTLSWGFQLSDDNQLAGAQGRVELLRALGRAVSQAPELFGTPGRVGNLYDALAAQAVNGRLAARSILRAILEGLGPIWPERHTLGDVNLGDVWPHPAAGGDGPSAGLVPIHKLSQWLTYSLVEPLTEAGLDITGQEELTALAEYRNGGLLVDMEVLTPRDELARSRVHAASDPFVIEWRALTVALIDEVARAVRALIGQPLSLGQILEGGTWRAGRLEAERLRPGAPSPFPIHSDGSVF